MPRPVCAVRLIACLSLALAGACTAPPTLLPDTPTPNGVQTAQALLTASLASLTPTASDTPGAATPSQTPRVSETFGALSEIPTATSTQSLTPTQTLRPPTRSLTSVTQTFRVSETLRVSTATATPSPTPTATLTPTAPIRIVPANAVSVTLAAVLRPRVISGTHPARLDAVAWAPDGSLAAAGAAGVLLAQGGELTVTRGYTMSAWTPALDFSPDGLALAAGNVAGAVRLFNRTDGGLRLQLLQPDLRVSQVRYRPGPPGVLAQMLASLGGDNTIYVWDVAYQKFLGTLNPGPGAGQSLAFSGDGRWLAGASGAGVQVWDVPALPPTGWTEPVPPSLILVQDGEVTALALSRDGFWLAAANATGTIELWTLPGGQQFGSFAQLNAPAEQLAFSADGQLVAAAHTDRVIRLWALAAPGAPLAALAGHTDRITGLAFSPDGTALASSSWDGSVRLWRVR